MGTTEESLHLFGNIPVEIERLNILVTGAAMLVATTFNMCPEMPSGPLDFETSIDSNRCRTSSSVYNRLSIESGAVSDDTSLLYKSGTFRGGRDLLKQLEKNVFNMLALS